jgi:hypothetical protein
MAGGWGRANNEGVRNLYASQNIIRLINSKRMRWLGCVARTGEMRNFCRILVGKPERKRLLGSPSHKLEENIRMDLREMR